MENIIKITATIKPLIIAAALCVAGNASASSYSLPVTANNYSVITGTYLDKFTFTVGSESSFSGSVGSSAFSIGSLNFAPVTFLDLGLDLISSTGQFAPVGSFSYNITSNAATFSASGLNAGNYVLDVVRMLPPGTTAVGGVYALSASLAPVPEPESYAMFLAGLGMIGAVIRRRRTSL